MFKLFIKRPILSGVISVIIVCLGVLSILTLPITQFPDIVPPSVTVTARYTGASADVMSKTVATPLERAINGDRLFYFPVQFLKTGSRNRQTMTS